MEKVQCTICKEENSGRLKFCASCGHEFPPEKIISSPPGVQKKLSAKKPAKKPVKQNLLKALAISLACMLSLYGTYIYFEPSYDEAVKKLASEMNQTCPRMVDPEIRLDNVGILPGNVFQYNYTMVNLQQAQVNTLELRNKMEPLITQSVKTSPEMEFQRENKAILNYYYQDKNGSYLFLISVTPDMYLQ